MVSRISSGLLFAIAILILLMDSSVHAQNWPMLNLNKERTSWVSGETELYPPLQIKYKYGMQTTGTYPSISYLSFYNNHLALTVGNTPNTLEVVDVTSSDTLWTFGIPESVASMNFVCAQNDSMIFAGGQKGLGLYALDRATGLEKWNRPIGTLYTKDLILDDGYGYILGDSLYCLDIKDGATIWSQNIKVQGTPAVDDSYVYVVGIYKIQIFDKLTGELLWWKSKI